MPSKDSTIARPTLSKQGEEIVQKSSKIAEEDMKTATIQIKKAVADGILPKPVMRDLVAHWGRGDFLWPFESAPKPEVKPEKPLKPTEAKIQELMKGRGMSRLSAQKYIDDGSYDMEQMQRAEDPMHKMYNTCLRNFTSYKMKKQAQSIIFDT